jgi:hypothetical protein
MRQAGQGRTQEGVPLDVDRLATGNPTLEVLGEYAGGSKPPDQLSARFRALVGAALVSEDSDRDVAEPAGDAQAPVRLGQEFVSFEILLRTLAGMRSFRSGIAAQSGLELSNMMGTYA